MTSALISVGEAQQRLIAAAPRVGSERLPLAAAGGRWLAGDVVARRNQPEADLSAMDGYALRFDDLPGPLSVIGESAAGRPFSGQVGPGEAVRIFTGAHVPPGTDAILVQEEARRDGDSVAMSGEGPGRPGRNIRRRGLDFDEGTLLAQAGDRLTPARVALAIAAGWGEALVNRPVSVGIVTTGDELVAPGTHVGIGQLPESNGAMLETMLRDLPIALNPVGIVPDNLETLTSTFRRFEGDILVTVGGASVGVRDLVRPALLAAGGEIDFWRIAMRPGKPLMAGRLGKTIVLGLPGNPVSAFVTATLFLRPLIAAMAGARDPLPHTIRAILADALPANDHRQDYLRARWQAGGVVPADVQDSSMLRILAESDCLIVRPPHAPAAQNGESVDILTLA